MKSYRTKPCFCLACGYFVDTASNVTSNRGRPVPNDVSVCLNCGHVLVFNDDLTVRLGGDSDLDTLPRDKREVARASQVFIRQRGPIPKKDPMQ